MAEINLLHTLPKPKRNLAERSAATEEDKQVALQYGKDYFDGSRNHGYGGYRYDGRWVSVAETFIAHWGLKPGDRVLDIGCAKGFLVKDFLKVCPEIEVFGIDISEYALMNCEPEVVGRLHLGNALKLPFPDGSFTAAISLNTLHNLERQQCIEAIKEMQRVAPGKGYIQVDAYRTEEEEHIFEKWVLTAKTHGYPHQWLKIFEEAGYTGDYYWTIIS
jgi:ubiquinone/menaquinone biosynthesis C-methylase UbiE